MSLSLVVLLCFAAIVVACSAACLLARDLVLAGRVAPRSRPLRRARTVFDEQPAVHFTGRLDQAFDRMVLETGLDLSPGTAFLMLLAAALLAGSVLFLYRDDPLAGLLGAAVGLILPLFYLKFRQMRRLQAVQEELPPALDLMARAVRAGQSLDQAITFLGEEAGGVLGKEFAQCAQQLEMGLSVAAAMQNLTRRLRVTELRMLATTLTVHRQTGGNLPVALERIAGVVRDRLNYRRQMRASTGAGRTSAMLIAVLSPLLYAVMFLWQPEHVGVLLDNNLGQAMLVAALVLEVLGIVWVLALLQSDL